MTKRERQRKDSQSIGVSSNGSSESEVFVGVASKGTQSRNRSDRLEERKRSFGDVELSDGVPSREGKVELLSGGESGQVPRISLTTKISSSRKVEHGKSEGLTPKYVSSEYRPTAAAWFEGIPELIV